MDISDWDKQRYISTVKRQLVALNESVESFGWVLPSVREDFLWETMIEQWARYGIRGAHPTAPPAYDFFCAWFPEFDNE